WFAHSRSYAKPRDPALLLRPVLVGSEHATAPKGDRFQSVLFGVSMKVQVSGRFAHPVRLFSFDRKCLVHSVGETFEIVPELLFLQRGVLNLFNFVAQDVYIL